MQFAALHMSLTGTPRHFAAAQQLSRFRSEADINFGWSRNRIYEYELERFDAYIYSMGKLHFDRTDYSIVVKNRAPLPNSWRWEIYRAGRSSPIEQSSVYFHSVATANRAGKEALRQLLDKLKV